MPVFCDQTGRYLPAPTKLRQEVEFIELKLLEETDGHRATAAIILANGMASLAWVKAVISRHGGQLVIETTNSVYAGPTR